LLLYADPMVLLIGFEIRIYIEAEERTNSIKHWDSGIR